MTTRDTITQFFENVLQRAPTTAELAVREALVANGSTLDEICSAIVNSAESQTFAQQVIRIYQTAFGRKPDAVGLDGWVDALRDGTITSMEMVDGFVHSAEWAASFGSTEVGEPLIQGFYQNMLGREASAEEVADWIATGDSIGEILIGVANSAEAQTHAAECIVQLQQAACNVDDPSAAYTGQGSLFNKADDPLDPDIENPDGGSPGGGGPTNTPPTVALENTETELPEDTFSSSPIKVANIVITDDGLGVNDLSLTGEDAALFEIVGSELFLIANTALDFEGGNSELDVTVTVDDTAVGATPDDMDSLTINVTNVNEAPTFISDDEVKIAESTEAATGVLVIDVNAVDPDVDEAENNGLQFALTETGTDNKWFDIDPDNGILTFINGPDFEQPFGDMDGEGGGESDFNSYDVQVKVTDRAGLFEVQDITVNVTNVDEAPVIFEPNTAVSFEITVPINIPIITTVTAVDPDNEPVSYRLDDNGSDNFTIDSMGQLTAVNTLVANTAYQVVASAFSVSGRDPELVDTISITIITTEADENRSQQALATGIGDTETDPLTQQEMTPLVDAAMSRWMDAGLSEGQKEILEGLNFVVMDLHDDLLGMADSNTVIIDINAAGNGWFVDQTPRDDSEFSAGAAAPGGIDLLTAIMHEMGHSIGLEEHSADPDNLMYGWLNEGERRAPDAEDVALIGQDYLAYDA